MMMKTEEKGEMKRSGRGRRQNGTEGNKGTMDLGNP